MKPFLGIDLTNDKNNEEFNGKEFIIQETSAAMSEALKNSTEDAEEVIEKSDLRYGCDLFTMPAVSVFLYLFPRCLRH